MAKLNPLQEQLLKAGLAKKSKAAQVAREQDKARHAKAPAGPSEAQLEAERARERKADHDRALAAARRVQARIDELAAQARQIIRDKKQPRTGDSEYRFTVEGAIRTLLVDDMQRRQLASGALVIVRLGDGFELLARVAGEQVRQRDAAMIVLDHGQAADAPRVEDDPDDAAYYAQFQVPDDLVW
jgi:uncharacterized protein YaiL (DUF2058 family)